MKDFEKYFDYIERPNHSIKIIKVFDNSTNVLEKHIQPGVIFDNYKELNTVIGGITYRAGDKRDRQMKNWKQYFDYKIKNDNSIEILEVFDLPDDLTRVNYKKKKERVRKITYQKIKTPRKNSIYLTHIEKILLHCLAENKGKLQVSKIELYKLLGMVNDNFDNQEKHNQIIKDLLPFNSKQSNKYFNFIKRNIYSKIKDVVESALKSMKRRELVDYEETFLIYYKNGTEHIATEEQRKNIVMAEKKSYEELGYTITNIFLNGNYKEINELVVKKIQENEDKIIGYKKIIDIKYIGINQISSLLLNNKTFILEKTELNNKIIHSCYKTLYTCKNKHLKIIKEQQHKNILKTVSAEATKEYQKNGFIFGEYYNMYNETIIDILINLDSHIKKDVVF